jgi:hypothetical protein
LKEHPRLCAFSHERGYNEKFAANQDRQSDNGLSARRGGTAAHKFFRHILHRAPPGVSGTKKICLNSSDGEYTQAS